MIWLSFLFVVISYKYLLKYCLCWCYSDECHSFIILMEVFDIPCYDMWPLLFVERFLCIVIESSICCSMPCHSVIPCVTFDSVVIAVVVVMIDLYRYYTNCCSWCSLHLHVRCAVWTQVLPFHYLLRRPLLLLLWYCLVMMMGYELHLFCFGAFVVVITSDDGDGYGYNSGDVLMVFDGSVIAGIVSLIPADELILMPLYSTIADRCLADETLLLCRVAAEFMVRYSASRLPFLCLFDGL